MPNNPLASKVTQWQRIVYDPLSWIDPSRVMVPDCFSRGRCRSVINQVILTELTLVVEEKAVAQDSLACLFIDEWLMLRRAGLLMACQRYRANLMCRGRLEALPASVRQFARLPLLASHYQQGEVLLSPDALQLQAQREILAFCPSLPPVLQQRVPLLFAKFAGNGDNVVPQLVADRGLLILAIQHAKRNPW